MFFNRKALADTFALITFGLVMGGSIELLIAGLTFDQMVQSRLVSIPINSLIARPYGIYRDWVMGWNVRGKKSASWAALLDVVAYLSFQIPVYAALLATTGAGVEQVLAACIGQMGVMVVMGRPFGLWMQVCRHWFGRTTSLEMV